MSGDKDNLKTLQIRATISEAVALELELEASKLGLELSLYIRIVLGERARILHNERIENAKSA